MFDPSGHIKLSDFGLASVFPKNLFISKNLKLLEHRTDLHWAHDTSCWYPYTVATYVTSISADTLGTDYENQRLHLLRKHGIDLEDSMLDGKKTKRMTSREIEQLMGGGDGQGGIFTWRDKHRRKVGTGSFSCLGICR